LKPTEDEENEWHILHSLGTQFKDYTSDSALVVTPSKSERDIEAGGMVTFLNTIHWKV
jgi:hypothetical protein